MTPQTNRQPLRRWTVEYTLGIGRRRQQVTAPTEQAAREIAIRYNPGAANVRVIARTL